MSPKTPATKSAATQSPTDEARRPDIGDDLAADAATTDAPLADTSWDYPSDEGSLADETPEGATDPGAVVAASLATGPGAVEAAALSDDLPKLSVEATVFVAIGRQTFGPADGVVEVPDNAESRAAIAAEFLVLREADEASEGEPASF